MSTQPPMTSSDTSPTRTTVNRIIELFHERGGSQYGGEAVTQLQHALQTATWAKNEGAPSALITAALLHDVGHLLHDLPENAPDKGMDDLHENLAAAFLRPHFGDDVVQPALLHVEAKRYLCTARPGYIDLLSGPSIQSLALQGGPMNADEVAAFELLPHYQAAVELRRWDDLAKNPEMVCEPIESFAEDIAACLLVR